MYFSARLLMGFLAASLFASGELLPRQKTSMVPIESGLIPSSTASSTMSMSTSSGTSMTFAVGADTSGTQPVTRSSNSVSVQTHASTTATSTGQIGGQVGGQAGGQGSAGVGEFTNTLSNLPGQTSTAGAWRAVQTVGAGMLGAAVAVQALL